MVYSGKRPASMAQLQSSATQQVFDEQHSTARSLTHDVTACLCNADQVSDCKQLR